MPLFRDQDSTVAGDVSEREVRAQLDRILQSETFKNSERLQHFLKFAVECVLDGATDQLKESALGRVVFDRGSEFDPRSDSIVRVEAQRLRRRLQEYHEIEGRNDPVAIEFQPGSYAPTFAYPGERHGPSGVPETRPLNPQTVAVLPLHNQSGDPEQEYFCEGITDDIIYALSRIPGLNVIGHASVFALKGVAQDARDVGAKLAAGTVVDGTVRKSGNRLKIFTEMLDATTGEVHWAQTYERPINDVFVIEAEIAEAVARVLQMTLAPPVSRGLVHSAPTMDAYLLYLRGRQAWNRMSADGYRTAAEILERAGSMYPSYAAAYAGLADAYARLALWGLARPREVFPKALRAAQQALRLDPSLPHAYSSLAAATAFYEWRWEEGTTYARTATDLEPSYSFGQHVYGGCLLVRGEMDQARECFERAVDLDPLSVRAHRSLGWMLYIARRFASAEQWLQAALVLDREPAETRYLLAHVYMSQRRFAAALEQAERCQTDPPDPVGLSVLGACLAYLNRREEALKIAATLSRMAEANYVQARAIARLHIALGNIDQAIQSVATSLDEREPFSVFLKLDPEFDPLRSAPRFDELVSRLGL
jgi:serine/threonine-protein kinase